MRKKGSLESWELKRNLAVDMHQQKHSPAVIAAALSVSVKTVYQWLELFRVGGREALASKKPPGRRSRLSVQQKQQLGEMLLKTPAEHGFAGRYLWTQRLIAQWIEREFGVKYHHDRICRILRMMGYTHQKPARRAVERDEVKIRQWREQTWAALLKKVPTVAE